MSGWLFAAGLFVAIVGFELAMFRLVDDDREGPMTDGGASAAADGSTTDDGAASGSASRVDGDRTRDIYGGWSRSTAAGDQSGGSAASDEVRVCPACGTENESSPTVTFCRACLGRLV